MEPETSIRKTRLLGFRRSDYLRSRFSDGAQDALTGFYHSLISARLDTRNRALRAPAYRYLPTRDGTAETRLWVAARWSDDGNVVFVAHNLWYADVAQSYYLPADLTAALQLRSDLGYRLVDALSGTQLGACRSGADLAWNFYVAMAASTRLQWMRLERC